MTMVNVTINGKEIQVKRGTTILDAAKSININIPTLCHMYMVDGTSRNCKGTCRICVVEVQGKKALQPSCSVNVSEGMVVKTNSSRAIKARKTVLELLLSDHPKDCLGCEKNQNCELQNLSEILGVGGENFKGELSKYPIEDGNPSIVRDMSKCILCRRCVTACNDVQNVNVLTPVERGFGAVVSTFFDKPLQETKCTYCGQCVAVCPTGALGEKIDYKKIWPLLDDDKKYVMAEIAPAVRVALGEEFGYEPGTLTTGKIVAGLRRLGFNGVYDAEVGADFTIMEEATEFIDRFSKKENLPLITSCCPAWVKFAESKYSENLKYISSCKSPQQMFASIAKNYLSKKINLDRKDMVLVSIMPCIAKKYEAEREEMKVNDSRDVDIVITTRELAKMFKEGGIDLRNIEEESFDSLLGEATGAGAIFGSTGGVMEAAVRTAYEWVTKETMQDVEFRQVRGLEGFKEATIELGKDKVNIAVVSSLKNARIIMEQIKEGNCKYDFVEIMACPGGCIDGGGQPYIKSNRDILIKRMKGLYTEDGNKTIRKSHESEIIKRVYEEFLESPNSHIAHELLHTTYKK
ncbi:NAD(P)-dependent iron-only hydrogenase catalytic subunit [Clostridium cavendishii DSM 21758]|uniref:NAD(P)-dependent iron-only hydrogenase catalytic subunit n=1 Tax=Clostridium cavendishii DSM 21758 TaxID=1121302 RepID=A0A1M6ERS6_9CLOT|nr:NADH-dependent [FeFe] hydrogenase, group A6 [Clostridium cavendishii]SHI88069.1 NAD(P)-dependent iron-only hydrogenase catalytic subunit [Clostridium cavendishii DSM 21758]